MGTSPNVGDQAPEATVLDYDTSEKVELSSTWAKGPAVVVFQRYYGCPFCQLYIATLLEDQQRFIEAGAEVVLIGHGERDAVKLGRAFSPYRVLFDAERNAYQAYGVGRGGWGAVAGPRVWAPFVHAHFKPGVRQRGLRGGDYRQLGATFVVDTAGIVRFVHRNSTAADNPGNDTLLEAVRAIGREQSAGKRAIKTQRKFSIGGAATA